VFQHFYIYNYSPSNNVVKLHLHSLRRSGEINDKVLKLLFLFELQAIQCRSAAKLGTVTK
jgi:hypothetical protein